LVAFVLLKQSNLVGFAYVLFDVSTDAILRQTALWGKYILHKIDWEVGEQ
jgi:hypothetical protein